MITSSRFPGNIDTRNVIYNSYAFVICNRNIGSTDDLKSYGEINKDMFFHYICRKTRVRNFNFDACAFLCYRSKSIGNQWILLLKVLGIQISQKNCISMLLTRSAREIARTDAHARKCLKRLKLSETSRFPIGKSF